MALRDFWRRRDEPVRTRFPLDPLSRDSWHDEAEARYGEHRYRNHPVFEEQGRRFNDRWQNSYSGPGYRRFGERSENEYGGSSNPFLGDRPLTRAGSAYDSGYFGHQSGMPKTPWIGEEEIPVHDEPRFGGGNPAEGELGGWRERGVGEFRGRGPRGYWRSDDRIKEDVCQRLTDDPYIDATDIEVTVKDREVQLSGTVQSRSEKRHAEDIIEHIAGVGDVINGLRVSNSQSR